MEPSVDNFDLPCRLSCEGVTPVVQVGVIGEAEGVSQNNTINHSLDLTMEMLNG